MLTKVIIPNYLLWIIKGNEEFGKTDNFNVHGNIQSDYFLKEWDNYRTYKSYT